MVRRLPVVASALVLVVASVVAAIDRESGASYKRGDVERAFARQGFTLIDTSLFGTGGPTETLLVPVSDEPFFIYIARSDGQAREAFAPYARMQSPETFDVLRGNVMAISDSGLSPTDRQRVRAAMQALGDGSST